jgi:hypothetical protein
MAGAWSQFSPVSPPSDEMSKMRAAMLKVLAETWDEYMGTPQFMEMMKASLNGALDLKRMPRDGTNPVHVQFETPAKRNRMQENAIERRGQTSKTKTQKPAATTSATHFTRQMRK